MSVGEGRGRSCRVKVVRHWGSVAVACDVGFALARRAVSDAGSHEGGRTEQTSALMTSRDAALPSTERHGHPANSDIGYSGEELDSK